jgi:hypothetical protein
MRYWGGSASSSSRSRIMTMTAIIDGSALREREKGVSSRGRESMDDSACCVFYE